LTGPSFPAQAGLERRIAVQKNALIHALNHIEKEGGFPAKIAQKGCRHAKKIC
jgi:hypothetical protein